MATCYPVQRPGNRGNAPLVPPFRYVDDFDHTFYLEAFTPVQNKNFRTHIMRLRVANDATNMNYGPFEVSCIPANRAIVSAFAYPFIFGFAGSNPQTADGRVVRPKFAIRNPRELELNLELNLCGGAIPDITGNTGVEPPIDGPVGRYLPGDFYTDYANSLEGVPATSEMRGCRIQHVQNDGADPSNLLTHTIYQLALSQGSRVRVSVANAATAPQVGDPYPLTQESGRFAYTLGQAQHEQDRMYPKRNMHDVPDVSSIPDHNQKIVVASNPYAIVAVTYVYDAPVNPSTLVKKVTLVNGSTVLCSIHTPTVIGEEIGDSTSTGDLQESLDLAKYVTFDAWIITAPALPDETIDGLAVDVWPL